MVLFIVDLSLSIYLLFSLINFNVSLILVGRFLRILHNCLLSLFISFQVHIRVMFICHMNSESNKVKNLVMLYALNLKFVLMLENL